MSGAQTRTGPIAAGVTAGGGDPDVPPGVADLAGAQAQDHRPVPKQAHMPPDSIVAFQAISGVRHTLAGDWNRAAAAGPLPARRRPRPRPGSGPKSASCRDSILCNLTQQRLLRGIVLSHGRFSWHKPLPI